MTRPVKFFHTKLTYPRLYGRYFVHWYAVKLKQKGAISKLFPQSWEHKVVLELSGQAPLLRHNTKPFSALQQTFHEYFTFYLVMESMDAAAQQQNSFQNISTH